MNLLQPLFAFVALLFTTLAGAWSVPTRAEIESEFNTWRNTFRVDFHSTTDFFHRFRAVGQLFVGRSFLLIPISLSRSM